MEIFIGLTAADGYKTLTADMGSDPVVSPSLVHRPQDGGAERTTRAECVPAVTGTGRVVPSTWPVAVWCVPFRVNVFRSMHDAFRILT